MPNYYKNILIVTLDELVPRFYRTYRALQKAKKRAEQRGYGIKVIQNGGGGHPLLIEFDSLPKYIQEEIGDPRKIDHILERYYHTDSEAVDFYSEFRFPDHSSILDKALERYVTNASVLKALISLKIDREREVLSKGGSTRHIMKSLCTDAVSFNTILKTKWKVEHSLPENDRRFKTRFENFIVLGYKSLINGNHRNSNAKIVTDPIIKLLNDMFAGQPHKPSYTEVAKQYDGFLSGYVEVVNNETAEIYDPKGYRKLSKSTITTYLADWENRIGTHAKRSGDRQKLKAKYIPSHSFDLAEFSGTIISVDDRQPPFEYAKGSRVWFYLAQDEASGAITTWVHGKTKEGIITDFYRQMVRNYAEWGLNLPAELEAESSLNSSFKETFLKEGNMFQYVRIEANNARGKSIEQRFNRQVRYLNGLEKEQLGWIARPFAKSESNQAGSTNVPMVPYNHIIETSLKTLETWNNMPHYTEKGKTRWEYLIEHQHPDLRPTNYRAILPYLGYKTKTSCNAGIINLDGGLCLLGDSGEIYAGERLIDLMKVVEGREITVYWLDKNDGTILKALVYIGNQYICEALPKPRYKKARLEQSEKDVEAREIMSKYSVTIETYMNRCRRELEKVTVIDNRKITLNNNFKILKPSKGSERVMSSFEPEILPEVSEFEDDLITVETSFKTSLKDRF